MAETMNDITLTAWLAEDDAGDLYLGAALRPWLRLGHAPQGGFELDAHSLIYQHLEPTNVRERVADDDMDWRTAERPDGTALIATWTAQKGTELLGEDLVSSRPPRGARALRYLEAQDYSK